MHSFISALNRNLRNGVGRERNQNLSTWKQTGEQLQERYSINQEASFSGNSDAEDRVSVLA